MSRTAVKLDKSSCASTDFAFPRCYNGCTEVMNVDRIWKEIIVAIAVGLIVPQLVFAVSDRVRSQNNVTEQTTAPTQTQAETAATEVISVMYIPVVDEGDVIILELEDYIRGVVLAEMPASFEMDALKAQAVAARTYTMRRLQLRDKHPQGAVCTDSGCCQAYLSDEAYLAERGTKADLAKISQAVAATEGEVLTYGGELIEATYFACSGGRTEDAVAVWGQDLPYLQAVDSPGEAEAEKYERETFLSAEEFQNRLGRTLKGGPDSWLGAVERTDGGGVRTMVIGGITYSGTRLRKLLGLNSTAFTMTADEKGITICTKGWGHRVGMSQYGADAMAGSGSDYLQILGHYYQGTTIDKLWDLG